jgi:hypothetical protein
MVTALNLNLRKTSNFASDLTKKMAEKAQHTGVCEHFEDIFSSNMEQKWALMGFNAIAMQGSCA